MCVVCVDTQSDNDARARVFVFSLIGERRERERESGAKKPIKALTGAREREKRKALIDRENVKTRDKPERGMPVKVGERCVVKGEGKKDKRHRRQHTISRERRSLWLPIRVSVGRDVESQ